MKRLFKWVGFILMGLLFLIFLVFAIAYYYKADILAAVNAELKKNVRGTIHIGNLDFSLLENFPSFSITLKDIYIRDENYDYHKKDFLRAEKMSLDVQIVSFLQKRIEIRSIKIVHGDIFIFRSLNGYTNLDIFRKRSADDTTLHNTATITFRKLLLNKVHVHYQDSLKEKSFGVDILAVKAAVFPTDTSYRWSLAGPLIFDDLTLNKRKGSFLKNKSTAARLNLEFLHKKQNLIIHPSYLKFETSELKLSGAFHFEVPGTFSLEIQTDDLVYQEGLSLLTDALQTRLRKFDIEKPMSVLATLKGSLESGSIPAIDIRFAFSNSKMLVPKININRATITGSFSNHADSLQPKNDQNSLMVIKSFSGDIEGLPTKLTATFKNLTDPSINLHSLISLNLSTINEKVDTTRMKFLNGNFKSEINYSGKLSDYLNPDKTNFTGKLKGSVAIKNGAFDYKPRRQHIKNVHASLRFTSDSLLVDSVYLEMNKNPVSITGTVCGFVPFFHQPEKKGYINLHVTSPSFNLSAVLSKSARKPSAKRKAETKKSISEMLDKLYPKVECDLTVRIDKLEYQNFKGSNVRGRLLLNNNALKAVNMKMKLAEGNVNFTLGLDNLQKETKRFSVMGTVENADIRQFFLAFNNFNQSTINHKNLEGKVRMNAKFSSNISDDFTILPKSMKGAVHLVINDGKLDGFEPLQKMNNFLFKNRDFDAVQFGEIDTQLTLTGPEVDIERMEIESSVLRLFLEGRYSFADSTDLSIQLPLSNLKRRDKNYQPKNIGVDAKAGPSIFLHVHKDESGKTVFAYDPFKRHVKK